MKNLIIILILNTVFYSCSNIDSGFSKVDEIIKDAFGPSAEEKAKIEQEAKDKELIDNAKSYMDNKISSESKGALKLIDLYKLNGIEKEIFGQKIYTFEYNLTIEAQNTFWKTTEDKWLNANWYWRTFYVSNYGSNGGWDDYNTNWKQYNKGDKIEITGEINFEKTDNGWRQNGDYKNTSSKN